MVEGAVERVGAIEHRAVTQLPSLVHGNRQTGVGIGVRSRFAQGYGQMARARGGEGIYDECRRITVFPTRNAQRLVVEVTIVGGATCERHYHHEQYCERHHPQAMACRRRFVKLCPVHKLCLCWLVRTLGSVI